MNGYELLKKYKYRLTRQQYNTLKGQLKSGDLEGMKKGLKKCLMNK